MSAINPFGMLFREEVNNLTSGLRFEYDATEQISVCYNELGEKVPFVTYGVVILGGTATATRDRNETTDDDPNIPDPRPR